MGRNNPAEAKGKTERQQTILRLIQEHPISRQEVLLEHLRQEGFEVTQATISRDIREFDALKWKNVVGTLSGDDTFLIVTRSERDAKTICSELTRHIGQK